MSVAFYNSLSSHYHLIFQDWDVSMRRQGAALAKLLPGPKITGRILDCACGIGTQTLALAALGYDVEGSDLSDAEVERARREAAKRNLHIQFRTDDMRTLEKAPVGAYGAVINIDNALAHLDSDDEIMTSLHSIDDRLMENGILLVSVRDYARHLRERTTSIPVVHYEDGGRRRVVSQDWEWQDERRYRTCLRIRRETDDGWESFEFTGHLRAVTQDEVAALMSRVGFRDVVIRDPEETGFYQPILTAKASDRK